MRGMRPESILALLLAISALLCSIGAIVIALT